VLFIEIITIYSENHMQHVKMQAVGWQSAEILNVKQVVHALTTVSQRVHNEICFKIVILFPHPSCGNTILADT
jgi:hypothetical protein